MTLVYADPVFERHRTGFHPECPDRVLRTLHFLEGLPWFTQLPRGRLSAATEERILRTHTRTQLETAKAASTKGGGYLDADTYVSAESFQTSLLATGSAIHATEEVLKEDGEKTAFCLIRPPGHHATPQQSMGFCVFNSIAVAAHYARDVHGLGRILIVDFDVHHGNGTQDIFYEDPAVHFLSIHRFPFYPGTGHELETGRNAGLGTTLNIPLSFGTSRAQYRERFRSGLDAMMEKAKPELVLISAGFDAHKDDPIGSLGLEDEDYSMMTQWIREGAAVHAKGRVVSCLEGGYNLDNLPRLIGKHIQDLAAP